MSISIIMKIIAFLSNKLTLRGTEITLYDYADYNEKILGNKSIIITRDYEKIKNEFDVDIQAYQKFQSRFRVEYYANNNPIKELDSIVETNHIDYLYIIKAGQKDGLISTKCKNLIHCVFLPNGPHGDVYSVVGQTVNNISRTNFPVVPHMIILPDTNMDLREELHIPKNAIVFGRYGGKETFDIPFAHAVIKDILKLRSDIYFIFMNTHVFYNHTNIIYLPGNSCMIYKRKFINTCDALLHARCGGETFGITCGEFAVCEKPVITWNNSRANEHLLILKDKAVIYENGYELFDILNTFTIKQWIYVLYSRKRDAYFPTSLSFLNITI